MKMFAVIDKTTNEVLLPWVGESESDADFDSTKYFLVEMTKENSPAVVPGFYINDCFVGGNNNG